MYGNLITTDQSAATITVAAGPGGALTGNATVNASHGVITFKNLSLPLAGAYSLQISDASLANQTPVLVAQTVSQGVTTLGGLPTILSRIFGQTITLSPTFKSTAPGSVPFTGVATLVDSDSDVLGTATLTAGGQARFVLTGIAPGTYLSSVSYPGDPNHTAYTSSTFTLTVNQAGTRTSLTASASTLVFGQPLTLTADVSSTYAPNVVRTGSVSFYDGLTLLQTVPLDGSSMASLTLTPATLGKQTFKAVYSGDGNFVVSTSSGLVRSVNKDRTMIALTPSQVSPIALNQTFNLDVQLSLLAPGAADLTGDLVTIKDNGKILTTLTLNSGGAATLPGLSYTAVGMHSLTVIFAGDADTLAVTSSALKLMIV
jgi:hypothetical protein